MEKSIEQLLEISKNPYYVLTIEENERLEAFLYKNSERQSLQMKNGKDSEKNIPATVLNKNVVKKDTGDMDKNMGEAQAVEEAVHPDAVK